jgi:hypothetical protein
MSLITVLLALFVDDTFGFRAVLEKAEKVQVTQTRNGEQIELRAEDARALAKLANYGTELRKWPWRPSPGAMPGSETFGYRMDIVTGEGAQSFFLYRHRIDRCSIAETSKGISVEIPDVRLWNALLDRFDDDIDRDTLKTWPVFEHNNFTGYDQFENAKAIVWSEGDLLVADEKANAILIYDATTNPLRPKLRQRLVHPALAAPRLMAICDDRVLVIGEQLVELKKVHDNWSVGQSCKHPQLVDASTCFASPSGKCIFTAAFPERCLLKFTRSADGIRFVSMQDDLAIGEAAFSKDGKRAYFVTEDAQKQTATLRIADYNEAALTFTTLQEKTIDNKPFLRLMLTPHIPPKRLLTGSVKVIGDRVYSIFSSGKISVWRPVEGDLVEEKTWKATFGGTSPMFGASIAAVGENQRLWMTFEGSENVAWFNSTAQAGGMGFGGSYRDAWRHFSTIEGLTVSKDGRYCYFVNSKDLIVLGGELKENREFYPRLSPGGRGEGDELYWTYFWQFRGNRDHEAKRPTNDEWRAILKERKGKEIEGAAVEFLRGAGK